MITPEQYKNIGGVELSNQSFPTYFIPSVTKNDYSKGYIYRYLVQKINDLTITEVNKDKYNEIYNQYKNKILERKGVQEQNVQTLVENEKKMKGIKSYLNNPLEFWGGK